MSWFPSSVLAPVPIPSPAQEVNKSIKLQKYKMKVRTEKNLHLKQKCEKKTKGNYSTHLHLRLLALGFLQAHSTLFHAKCCSNSKYTLEIILIFHYRKIHSIRLNRSRNKYPRPYHRRHPRPPRLLPPGFIQAYSNLLRYLK